jgi:hypothetical protein
MRTLSLCCGLAWLVFPLRAQHRTLFDPDQILVGERKLPHVLLLGTFHFSYPGLDAHKTAKDDEVDVMSPQRQKEMEELIEVIMRFKPNKLAVETQGGWLMHEYRDYKAGKELARNEYFQIGFRVMDRAKLDTLYAVDARPLSSALYSGPDSLTYRPWLDSLYAGWDWGGDDRISARYDSLYKAEDRYEGRHSLLDIFLSLNEDRMLDRYFGAYLNGGFLLDAPRGADILSIHWYNRNLRIYRALQQITTSPDDRILVLFGAGHMGILKHLFQCDPAYKLVRLKELVE